MQPKPKNTEVEPGHTDNEGARVAKTMLYHLCSEASGQGYMEVSPGHLKRMLKLPGWTRTAGLQNPSLNPVFTPPGNLTSEGCTSECGCKHRVRLNMPGAGKAVRFEALVGWRGSSSKSTLGESHHGEIQFYGSLLHLASGIGFSCFKHDMLSSTDARLASKPLSCSKPTRS